MYRFELFDLLGYPGWTVVVFLNEVHPYCNNELSAAQKGVSPTAVIIIAAFELQL